MCILARLPDPVCHFLGWLTFVYILKISVLMNILVLKFHEYISIYFYINIYISEINKRIVAPPSPARPDPVGESKPKPRGRSVLFLFIFRVIKFLFSKVSRPESPSRPGWRIQAGARFTPTFSIILSRHLFGLCYSFYILKFRGSISFWASP